MVIVGHGDSPKGCGWGKRIDEHIVWRLKDPSWQTPDDYGKRVDYMCSSTETLQVMLDYKRIPIKYYGQPKKGSWSEIAEARFRERAQAPLEIPLDIHNHWKPVYLDFCRDPSLAPNHSVGTAAITYAAAFLKPDQIKLVGFDNLLDPYRLDYYKANKGKWPSKHDWLAENKMLPMIEKDYGVEIRAFR